MGRKKIEIRPLTDERNRNVTFLKRKAGLMKKAWELSVLCGAEVSILIFNAAGKPYEFSSRELDGEIDRYLEYEGLIERRRGEEFAAMAEAGEDDDDEDDDEAPSGRKNSKAGLQAAAGPNGQKPVKSLKGKESFKKRMYSRRDMARSAHKRKRMGGGDRDGKQGFIDGILSSSDDEGMGSGGSSDGLAYALNMHQHPAFASLPYPSSLPGGPSSVRNSSLKSEYYPTSSSYPPMSGSSGVAGHNIPPGLSAQFGLGGQVVNGLGSMSTLPANMGGIQWDANLAQRYAEFQLQQNHQRQQRLLLERQRAQLAELGVNIDGAERRLLDDVFGVRGSGSGASAGQGASQQQHASQAQMHGGQHHTPASHGGMSIDSTGPPPGSSANAGAASSASEAEFIWPSFGASASGAGAGPSSSGNSGGTNTNTVGGGADTDGRGYYTTPESYDHHPQSQPHHSSAQVQAMQDHWAAQAQAQNMGYPPNTEGDLPIIPGQATGHGFASPMSYDEERRRRDEMYAQGHVQGQGQQGSMGGLGHHEKRIRVA